MARKLILGTYDTDTTGGWTLSGLNVGEPELQTNYVDVPGRRKGPLDLTAVLTDGEPTYGLRTITATLEQSNGTRADREAIINTMINWLDGWRLDIKLPDDTGHYMTGRVRVRKEYNDLAHAAVTVEATCDPWRYANTETTVTGTASTTEKSVTLTNGGRMTVVPLLTVTGGPILFKFGAASWSLSSGTYALPDMYLPPGSSTLKHSGSGSFTLKWREAVL